MAFITATENKLMQCIQNYRVMAREGGHWATWENRADELGALHTGQKVT